MFVPLHLGLAHIAPMAGTTVAVLGFVALLWHVVRHPAFSAAPQ